MSEPMSDERLSDLRRMANGSRGSLSVLRPEEVRELIVELDRVKEERRARHIEAASQHLRADKANVRADRAERERDVAQAKLARVKAEHVREPAAGGMGHYCGTCRNRGEDGFGVYPCPTIRAIENGENDD